MTLADALVLAHWSNAHDRPSYHRPGHHTLSVYLRGGHGTHLVGQPTETGAPGRYCVLAADHESHWQVGSAFEFLHLYVSPQAWADRVVRLLDAEPRACTLEQRIFGDDAPLAAWAHQVSVLDWSDPHERLQAHMLSHQALDRLVLMAARPRVRQAAERVSGGLSPQVRRRVLEYIEAHLDGASGPLSLGAIAGIAHLSEYHFARMFRASMMCSVHVWVTQRRLMRARDLLVKGVLPMEQVAAACGFASAGHLIRSFKKHWGLTPARFRQCVGA